MGTLSDPRKLLRFGMRVSDDRCLAPRSIRKSCYVLAPIRRIYYVLAPLDPQKLLRFGMKSLQMS